MIKAIIKSMRPRQWTKNVFVLAPLVFDRQLTNVTALTRSVAGMLLFCLISSCVYVLNDIMDVESDRVHPYKKNRPIASGALPIKGAYLLVAVLLLITIPLSFWLSPAYGIIALIYFGINLAYSIWLKHIPLIDVLIIAACYVLRVAAGVVLITVQRLSPWLYIVTTLFALFIGFGKRRAELSLLEGEAKSHRRVLDGYNIPLLDQLITIVSGTTVVAYSLYTFTAPNVPPNHAMMLTIPFILYGIFRYLWLISVKHAGGAPEELVFTDRPLQVTILLWGLSVLLIFYTS
jgi:4-hydroxybenzoate polyprenyltransferase